VENTPDKLRKAVGLQFARAWADVRFRRRLRIRGKVDLSPRNTWRARGYQGQSPDSRAAPVEALKTVLVFCGASLLVWLLSATYGLDISSGFFSPLADRADVLSKGRDQPGARPASALSRIVRG
jgi:hypothetical protein